jgi:hypothetical protein
MSRVRRAERIISSQTAGALGSEGRSKEVSIGTLSTKVMRPEGSFGTGPAAAAPEVTSLSNVQLAEGASQVTSIKIAVALIVFILFFLVRVAKAASLPCGSLTIPRRVSYLHLVIFGA